MALRSTFLDFLSENINKILVGLIALIVLCVAIVTLAAPAARKGPAAYRKADPLPEEVGSIKIRGQDSPESRAQAAFKIGDLRIPLEAKDAEGRSATLCVSPWFAYPEGDSAFLEELNAKLRKLKVIITEYFIHKSQSELADKGEPKIKEELLGFVNSELVMGKISAVYFNQYMFLE